MKNILDQLARNSRLLPDDMAAAILEGKTPPIEEVALQIVFTALDGHAVATSDPTITRTERCFAHLLLANAFLAALAVANQGEPKP